MHTHFILNGNKIMVDSIIDRWYSPDCEFFKVLADDGNRYLIKNHFNGVWTLENIPREPSKDWNQENHSQKDLDIRFRRFIVFWIDFSQCRENWSHPGCEWRDRDTIRVGYNGKMKGSDSEHRPVDHSAWYHSLIGSFGFFVNSTNYLKYVKNFVLEAITNKYETHQISL